MKIVAATMMFLMALVTVSIANRWKNIVETNDYKDYQRTSHGKFHVTVVFPFITGKITKGQGLISKQFKDVIVARFIDDDSEDPPDEGTDNLDYLWTREKRVKLELFADITKRSGKPVWGVEPVVVGRKISLLSADRCCIYANGVIESVSFSDEATPLAPYRLSKND